MAPPRGAWLPMKALQHETVLSGPEPFDYKCRIKVSRDGQKLRIYVTLGPRNIKAIFIDVNGNITSEGCGPTIADAAASAGAEGVLLRAHRIKYLCGRADAAQRRYPLNLTVPLRPHRE
jgi:hypothetical protein